MSTDSPSRPAEPPDVREPGEPVETTHVEVTEDAPPVTVEVVEPPIPDRVRRPADLFRLVLALVLLIGGVSRSRRGGHQRRRRAGPRRCRQRARGCC